MTWFKVLDVNGNNVTKRTLLNRRKMCFVITSIALHFVVYRPMARILLLLRRVQRLVKRMNYIVKSFKLDIPGKIQKQKKNGGQWPTENSTHLFCLKHDSVLQSNIEFSLFATSLH